MQIASTLDQQQTMNQSCLTPPKAVILSDQSVAKGVEGPEVALVLAFAFAFLYP